ncbi:MAG: ABC transporter ATP-binding protein [Thermoanaerobaculia bacterium]
MVEMLPAISRGGSLRISFGESLNVLAPFARRHRGRLLEGCAAALAVVALRLLLPWPLRSWLDLFLAAPADASGTGARVAALALAFLLMALGLGLANLLTRVCFARFAISMVADLRAAAFAAVAAADAVPAFGSGEAVARLIGDAARIKAAVKGFLVHVITHGLFVAGMTAVLFWIWPPLGWVSIVGAAVLAVITAAGAASVLKRAARYRGREGQLAEAIRRAWDEEPRQLGLLDLNHSSGEHEAALTRIQELVTWGAHAVFAGVLLVCLALASGAVSAGRLVAADLVLVAFYGLMLRTPSVQLARQGTRTGKIFACIERVGALTGAPSAAVIPRGLSRLELRATVARGRRRQLGPLDLELASGQHVAVLGRPGSGKTTLVRLLAGLERPVSGAVLWDGERHPGAAVLSPRHGLVGLLDERPVWSRAPISELLGLAADATLETLPPAAAATLEACGAAKLLRRLPKGLATKLAAAELSSRERRAVAVARAVLTDATLVLLDEPARDLGRRRGERLLSAVCAAARGRTLVATCRRPLALDLFDRVIELRRGRVVYDGSPRSWRPAESAGRPPVAEVA